MIETVFPFQASDLGYSWNEIIIVFPISKRGLFLTTVSMVSLPQVNPDRMTRLTFTMGMRVHSPTMLCSNTPITCWETCGVYDITTRSQSRPYNNTFISDKHYDGHHQNVKKIFAEFQLERCTCLSWKKSRPIKLFYSYCDNFDQASRDRNDFELVKKEIFDNIWKVKLKTELD